MRTDEPTTNVIPFPGRQRSNPTPPPVRYQAALDLFCGRNTSGIELDEAAARHLEMLNRELR